MFYEVLKMADQAHAAPNSSTGAGMRSEIVAKWSKFSAAEVAALKTKDDLIAQVQSKYSLDKAVAQKDVDTFANGRPL
jgi:hypothetical protein